MAKESTIRRSKSRTTRAKPEDKAEKVSEQVRETSNPEEEPRRLCGRPDRRSSLVRLGNIQYAEFKEMIAEDPHGVFDLCEQVYKEAVESIDHLYKDYRKLQENNKLVLEDALTHAEEAVTHRDIAIRERDALAYRLMQNQARDTPIVGVTERKSTKMPDAPMLNDGKEVRFEA
jgi:hypothetical protein